MENKLALVLSGGFVKGAAHISIAQEMYKRGYVPDVFVGTSIGAVFAVLLGLYDDPKVVKEISLKFVKKHIWPRLLSFDPFSKAGLLESKETVRLIAKAAGFEGKTFKDLKKPVYITATDLNTGKLIVFGSSALQSFSSSALLTEALEASISFPVIFKPKKMRAGSKVLALADGGIRENCPISVAARVPGVKRIIACDLGYCGQLRGDFNKKGMIDVFMQCLELTTSFSQINRYINDDLFADNKISVRIINPGIFDVGPFAFGKVPDVLKRASRTARRVFGAFKKPGQFFKPWSADPIKCRGIKIEHIGERGTNAVQVVDFS
jgi:NTE family protein